MELSLLYLSLLLLTVSAEFLSVDPDYDQIFTGDYVTLSCDESWNMKRNHSTDVQPCWRDNESEYPQGFICRKFQTSDSGLYWCESAAGVRSPQRLLSFIDRNLILDSPALPVAAGSDITLSCRTRARVRLNPVLVKDGTVVQEKSQWIVHKPEWGVIVSKWSFTVSKEHEGEYSCRDKNERQEESEKKRLQVTGHSLFPGWTYSAVWWQVVRTLLLSSLYGVCTVQLVLVYRGQRRTGSPGLVSMETGQQQQEEEYNNVDAVVTTEHRFS